MKILSIISPFHNSINKCERLLRTLGQIDDPQVELILVDDGSTDGTYAYLEEFKRRALTETVLVSQENRGPGGARNHGLRLACGEYVWFVDSDDDINIEAIAEIKMLSGMKYDFIDFNFESKGKSLNTIGLEPGEYSSNRLERYQLIKRLGRIGAKVFNRLFLINNNLVYPEFCLYEDNPYEFIFPFYIASFYKSDILAYHHNEEYESVTRGSPSLRFFDRMYTAIYGFSRVEGLASREERALLEEKFVKIYLFKTVAKQIKKKPRMNWIMALRVMRQYRDVAKSYDININAFDCFDAARNRKYKAVFSSLWLVSYFLPRQADYFDRIRLEAWGRPFAAIDHDSNHSSLRAAVR